MLLFRPITVDDAPFINRVRNGYAKEFLHTDKTFTLEETVAWIGLATNNIPYWIIELDRIVVGYFRLSIQEDKLYIGADIAPEHTGKGIAKQSYKFFIPFVLEKYNTNELYLEVLSTNHRAKRLYDSLGFVEISRYPMEKNGESIESIVMKYENRN